MTKKIFTDEETGEKFETVISDFNYDGHTKNMKLIQPIKQDKQTYILRFFVEGTHVDDNSVNLKYDLTPEQAKAVNEVIEQLMFYLTNPKDTSGKTPSYESDMDKMIGLSIVARKALNEDN